MTLLCAVALLASVAGSREPVRPADEAVHLANLERVKLGLAPVKADGLDAKAAQWLAEDLAARDACDHIDSLGRDFRTRSEQFEIPHPVAENCAAGQPDAKAAIEGWMASAGHRKNLLNARANAMGVGYAKGPQELLHYWTMVLSAVDGYPALIDNEAPTTDRDEVTLFLYGQGVVNKIRLSNGDGAWTEWRPFQESFAWTLTPGKGKKVVQVESVDADGRTWKTSDTIERL